MAIPADVRAALDAQAALIADLTATVAQHRQQAAAAVTRLDGRIDAGGARLDDLEQAAQRLRRALREGRFDGDGDMVEALTTVMGVDLRTFRTFITWGLGEMRKVGRR